VTLSGALTPKVWTDKQGDARPALDLRAPPTEKPTRWSAFAFWEPVALSVVVKLNRAAHCLHHGADIVGRSGPESDYGIDQFSTTFNVLVTNEA
jgi:hypothetical protein